MAEKEKLTITEVLSLFLGISKREVFLCALHDPEFDDLARDAARQMNVELWLDAQQKAREL